jgi:hypothetical protein
MNLLPLLSLKEYRVKYPHEQGITFEQVINQLMCSQHREYTWDQVIDLLLVMNMMGAQESISDIVKKSESATEIFGTISQLSLIRKE